MPAPRPAILRRPARAGRRAGRVHTRGRASCRIGPCHPIEAAMEVVAECASPPLGLAPVEPVVYLSWTGGIPVMYPRIPWPMTRRITRPAMFARYCCGRDAGRAWPRSSTRNRGGAGSDHLIAISSPAAGPMYAQVEESAALPAKLEARRAWLCYDVPGCTANRETGCRVTTTTRCPLTAVRCRAVSRHPSKRGATWVRPIPGAVGAVRNRRCWRGWKVDAPRRRGIRCFMTDRRMQLRERLVRGLGQEARFCT